MKLIPSVRSGRWPVLVGAVAALLPISIAPSRGVVSIQNACGGDPPPPPPPYDVCCFEPSSLCFGYELSNYALYEFKCPWEHGGLMSGDEEGTEE